MTRTIACIMAFVSFFSVSAQEIQLTEQSSEESVLSEMVLTDGQYAQACGPIAVYASLRFLNIDCDLDRIAMSCGWSKGQAVSLQSLLSVLNQTQNIQSRAVRIGPNELVEWLSEGNRTAIVPLHGDEPDGGHAVTIYAASGYEGLVYVVGYPELKQQTSIVKLQESWNGAALLIERSESHLGLMAWWTFPPVGLLCGSVAGWAFRRTG